MQSVVATLTAIITSSGAACCGSRCGTERFHRSSSGCLLRRLIQNTTSITTFSFTSFRYPSPGLVICYWLLIRYRIRYPLVWLLALLACSAPFLYRLNMTKAPPFAIIYLVIGIHFLFTRKYWPLVPLSFVF